MTVGIFFRTVIKLRELRSSRRDGLDDGRMVRDCGGLSAPRLASEPAPARIPNQLLISWQGYRERRLSEKTSSEFSPAMVVEDPPNTRPRPACPPIEFKNLAGPGEP